MRGALDGLNVRSVEADEIELALGFDEIRSTQSSGNEGSSGGYSSNVCPSPRIYDDLA